MASKYGNKRCEFDGFKFASQAERARYIDLLDMQKRGLISGLTLQPKFLLSQGFERDGTKYRAEHYISDFQYVEEIEDLDGNCFDVTVVEDVKGMMTAVYKNKRKKFLALNPIVKFREARLIGRKWDITEF